MSLSLTQFPRMTCDDNCGKCCGFVLCKPEERDAVAAYAADHSITPRRQGSTCPFFQDGRCAVYPVRPFICRLFGHSPRLVCPNGHNMNISLKREERITREYALTGEASCSLHSFAYGEAEELALMMDYARTGE